MELSSATRRTTTIRRSQRRERFLLLLPGFALLVGIVLVLRGGFDSSRVEIRFNNFVGPEHFDAPDDQAALIPSRSSSGNKSDANNTDGVQVDANDETTEAPIPASQYHITIRDENGNPVPNARVSLVEIGRVTVASAPDGGTELFEPFSQQTMSSDENGELAIEASERGNRYELVVEMEGYAAKHYRLRDPGKRYTLQLHRSASIAGRVTDDLHQPLAGITVELWHDINRNETTVTDINGDYAFNEVTPTTATIRIHDPSFKRARQHVVVVEGCVKYFRDFVLEPGLHLDVGVIDPEAQPVGLATVSLIELESGLVVGRAQTDTRGHADFSCLDARRRYMAVVTSLASGGGRALVGVYGDLLSQSLVIQTRELWTYYGLVRTADGLPLPGTQVVIESEAFDGASSTSKDMFVVSTDEEGRFFVPNLDPSLNYAALIYHQQFAMQQLPEISPFADPGETGVSEPQPLTPEAPKQIILAPAASMEGLLVGPGGDPLSESIVYLSQQDDHLRSLPGGQISLRTDSRGRFFVGNLAAGNYLIQARHLSSGLTTIEMPPIEVRSGESLQQQFSLTRR